MLELFLQLSTQQDVIYKHPSTSHYITLVALNDSLQSVIGIKSFFYSSIVLRQYSSAPYKNPPHHQYHCATIRRRARCGHVIM